MTPSEKQLLRRIRDKIDSVEIGYEAGYELQLFLLNIACEDEPTADEEPAAWRPKVGDEVVFTDGITDDHYRVTRVHGRRCKLERDGTIQDGWFDFDSLAPVAPDEPTEWNPKPGDRVRFKGQGGPAYDVIRVSGDRLDLKYDGVVQVWSPLIADMEPAPAEPTDTEMLDWLASREFSLDHEKGRWFVCGMGYGLPSDSDLRSALRAAMRKDK